MKHKVSYEDLREAFVDVVEMQNAFDIRDITGMDIKRCEEIRKILDTLIAEEKSKEAF